MKSEEQLKLAVKMKADPLENHHGDIKVERDGEIYFLQSPYNAEWIDILKKQCKGIFDGNQKKWKVGIHQYDTLKEVLPLGEKVIARAQEEKAECYEWIKGHNLFVRRIQPKEGEAAKLVLKTSQFYVFDFGKEAWIIERMLCDCEESMFYDATYTFTVDGKRYIATGDR